MHTFLKTLFRFPVFSKGFYYLLNGNSILNSKIIRARVNNLSLFLKIAKFLKKTYIQIPIKLCMHATNILDLQQNDSFNAI